MLNIPRGCELCPGNKFLPDEDWEEKTPGNAAQFGSCPSPRKIGCPFLRQRAAGLQWGERNPPASFAPAGAGPFHSTLAAPCD